MTPWPIKPTPACETLTRRPLNWGHNFGKCIPAHHNTQFVCYITLSKGEGILKKDNSWRFSLSSFRPHAAVQWPRKSLILLVYLDVNLFSDFYCISKSIGRASFAAWEFLLFKYPCHSDDKIQLWITEIECKSKFTFYILFIRNTMKWCDKKMRAISSFSENNDVVIIHQYSS